VGLITTMRQTRTTPIDARFRRAEGRNGPRVFHYLPDGGAAIPILDPPLYIIKRCDCMRRFIEIVMPSSPIPMADVQRFSGGFARAEGLHDPEEVRLRWCAAFATTTPRTPLVLMGYYNPIYIYGVDRFPRTQGRGRRMD